MNRIKELRKALNINQDVLADFLNVNRSAISKYENGDIPLTDENIKQLSDYFNVTTDYLLGRSDNPGTQKSAPEGTPEITDKDIMFALWGGDAEEITDDMYDDVKRYAQFIADKKKKPDTER